MANAGGTVTLGDSSISPEHSTVVWSVVSTSHHTTMILYPWSSLRPRSTHRDGCAWELYHQECALFAPPQVPMPACNNYFLITLKIILRTQMVGMCHSPSQAANPGHQGVTGMLN